MSDLKHKLALVTGASRGIGKAISLKLAEMGADLIIHYGKNDAEANDTLQKIKALGTEAYPLKADLSSLTGIDLMFRETDRILKGKNIDVLVNNAGILHRKNITEISESEFDELFAVNLKAPFFITKRVISLMNKGGRIINISSYLSERPKYDYGCYSMTKAALDNFTKSMAFELGSKQITINSVAPGSTDTDMNRFRFKYPEKKEQVAKITALGRVGTAEDIAEVVGFLASENSHWITGQCIEVSGGLGLG
jgi:NAD(P)-dependent dehydrogenase (short-subunit alcohol dehydrogenase family)